MSQKLKFVSRILTLAVFVTVIVLLFRWCTKKGSDSEFTIADTPIKVEMIRSIAEIATVSYRDEVVVDSVEMYKNTQEIITGSLLKLTDPKDFKYGLRSSVKRRLTLIVKGEIRYGFDLKKNRIRVQETDSVMEVFLPQPEIVDIQVTPSSTEFFQENGDWKDYEIKSMQNKARQKLIANAETLNLRENARASMTTILKQMLGKEKPFKITFEQ